MMHFILRVETEKGLSAEFQIPKFGCEHVFQEAGLIAEISECFPYCVRVAVPQGDKLKTISYTVSIGLKNFHEVIVPDTGRTYPSQMQLVDFWGKKWESRINNIRMPLFILTGTDLCTDYVFGVLGPNVETDFIVDEPACNRALCAWMKRFTLTIKRGCEDYPIADFAIKDNVFEDHIYFKEADDFVDSRENWILTLRDFAEYMRAVSGVSHLTTDDSMLPYWCSWTDWFSDDVDEKTILDNVREGVKLGIKNYIIDDGWFGPGLDTDFSVKLNIGDWRPDPAKISDMHKLVESIHELEANAIIWCAPHAVSRYAECYHQREKYLIRRADGELFTTTNNFHSLCFMSPEGREIMADICARLAADYGFDGAKYDLFNCVCSEPCCGRDHEHDTASTIEGLQKTLKLIDSKTKAIKADYIVELKQNYATPYLYEYGTCVRAGDTPYNPEGNFLRTAYINAYTPYSINDYQTITNHDTLESAARIAIKMMCVGIPTYSIDFVNLDQARKDVMGFYHRWYIENIEFMKQYRQPVDPELGQWRITCGDKDIVFLVNDGDVVRFDGDKDIEILNGSRLESIICLLAKESSGEVQVRNYDSERYHAYKFLNEKSLELDSKAGDIISISYY